jgi:hypothetical protein
MPLIDKGEIHDSPTRNGRPFRLPRLDNSLSRDARECTHGDQDAPWVRTQDREFRARAAQRFAVARGHCLLVISAAKHLQPLDLGASEPKTPVRIGPVNLGANASGYSRNTMDLLLKMLLVLQPCFPKSLMRRYLEPRGFEPDSRGRCRV